MIKLIAFDIDGTLAPQHGKSLSETVELLKELEKQGIKICLISGKPIMYVAGMARQMGIKNPIISGENGAIIYLDMNFPIQNEIKFKYDKKDLEILEKYKKLINNLYREYIWVQPNDVNFSFFVKDENKKNEINELTYHFFKHSNFEYYVHSDGCFDIVIRDVNKAWAINSLKKILNVSNSHIITVGDGYNDVPMFEVTYYSIGINRSDTLIGVENINEAFEAIKQIISPTRVCDYCEHKKFMIWEITEQNRVLGECDKCENTKNLYHFEKNSFYNDIF